MPTGCQHPCQKIGVFYLKGKGISVAKAIWNNAKEVVRDANKKNVSFVVLPALCSTPSCFPFCWFAVFVFLFWIIFEVDNEKSSIRLAGDSDMLLCLASTKPIFFNVGAVFCTTWCCSVCIIIAVAANLMVFVACILSVHKYSHSSCHAIRWMLQA